MVVPGVTTPGSVVDTPVDLSVVYPTLTELAGLPPVGADGQSVMPLLKDRAATCGFAIR